MARFNEHDNERRRRPRFTDEEFAPDWPYDGARRYDLIVAMRRALRAAEPVGFRTQPLPRDENGLIPDEVRRRLCLEMTARKAAVHTR